MNKKHGLFYRKLLFLFSFAALFTTAMSTLTGCDDGSSGGKTLASIAVTTLPRKTAYKIGEDLNIAGMVITATYSDGSTAVVTGYTTTGFTSDIAGAEIQTITVSYTEGDITKTADFTVTINKILTFIAISTLPAKTVYGVGEPLNTAGMVVTAMYSDGTTAEVRGYSTSGFTSDTVWATRQTITVSYTEGGVTKTATFTVTINTASGGSSGKTLASVVITAPPVKTVYTVGESLDVAGMIVTATYTDGTTAAVSGYTASGFNSTTTGSQTVTVSYTEGGVTKTVTFTVIINAASGGGGGGTSGVPVTGISLEPPTLNRSVGDTYNLIATIRPSNATNQGLQWSSSNTSVATVNANQVTFVGVGTATITVTTADGGHTATCEVTVTPSGGVSVPVSNVTLTPSTLSLVVGQTYNLTATITPSNATNQGLEWSNSDPSIATFNSTTRVVTAVAVGTTTITVTSQADSSKTASCVVTVSPSGGGSVPVSSVSLDRTALSLVVGDTYTLTATINPTNATNQGVTWGNTSPSIATFNSTTREVRAVAVGTTTITVTTADGNHTASCVVTVSPSGGVSVPVSSVSLDRTTLSLVVGDTYTLTAAINPTNATNQNVTWGNTNPSIATFNSTTRVVTAVAVGTTTITVTTADGGYTATCVVTVSPSGGTIVPVSGVRLDRDTLILVVGTTSTLTATIDPTNATNQNVTWSSSNPSKATVNNGVVSAVAVGTATITVTTADGGYTATCVVTVIPSGGSGDAEIIPPGDQITPADLLPPDPISILPSPSSPNLQVSVKQDWRDAHPTFTTYSWFIDGTPQSETTYTLTVVVLGNLTPGGHSVTVVVSNGTVFYSATKHFEVVQ